MKWMRSFFKRLTDFLGKRKRDAEFAAELESHLRLHIEDSLRRGMTLEAARRDALMKLGGVEQTKEIYRERRGLPFIESLVLAEGHAAQEVPHSTNYRQASGWRSWSAALLVPHASRRAPHRREI